MAKWNMAKWNKEITNITNKEMMIMIISFVLGFVISFLVCWQTMFYMFRLMRF
ncbi:MAG: hypothetical protein V1865_00145 [bacterium]